ncbi:Pre-mRNA-processing factor 19 [Heracleum sosnowskyi]|uniref:Pre-mRNA-processing factor 19 n=1 Tax=Heracleum sosnowskyi TaxID=360622 RepID=A0AAD8IV03_9APIA|nr:Pre-mRNA-processing factor 19 [Heracleum sosnowskyi]
MNCAISQRVPNVLVVSKTSGLLFEKELIEKYILDYGKCPVTGGLLTMDDIIELKTSKVTDSKSAAPVLNTSSLSDGKVAAEQSECLQFPDSIAEQITSTCINLSQIRNSYRKISTSLASVDAVRGYVFNNGYTLHQTTVPGVLSLDIENSKEIIATGGADTNAVVFHLSSGKTISTLSGHSEKVTSVKFGNEGDLVVTGSSDKTVRVWQRSEKGIYKCKDTLAHHTAEVRAVTIHPSQKYLVTASLDCSWKFYDLSSESRVAQVACGNGSERFSSAVFHPDGHIFGTCASGLGLVRFWDVAKQDNILKLDAHSGPVTSIAFSENGYTLATAAAAEDVKLWDLRFLRTIMTFRCDDISAQTRSVDFDHSGRYLAIGGEQISIYEIGASRCSIYEIDASRDPITTFSDMPAIGGVSCVKFGEDAKYVAAAGTSDSKLLLFGL